MSYNSLYSQKASKSVKVYDFDSIKDSLSQSDLPRRPNAGVARPQAGTRGTVPASSPRGAGNAQPKRTASAAASEHKSAGAVGTASAAVAQTIRREAMRTVPRATTVRVRTVRSTHRNPFPLAVVFLSVISTVLFMYLIFNMVQINEATQDIARLQTQLTSLKTEAKDLTLELEKKNDLNAIEEYAVNELGMVKMDQLTKKYVTIDNGEKVEIVEPEPEDTTGPVTTIMSAITENFRSVFGIN